MRSLLLVAALAATALASGLAPAPLPASPAPAPLGVRSVTLDTAPLQPAPTKQTAPAPVLLASSRRRRRVLLFTERAPAGGHQFSRPPRHRYNRAAHRHARNGWTRQGHN